MKTVYSLLAPSRECYFRGDFAVISKWIPVLMLILAGCGAVDAENELDELIRPDVELIPLAVGNYWVYDQWQVEPTWRDTVRNEIMSMHDVIIENTRIRAFGSYRFRYDERPREDALISLLANGLEGHYSLGFEAPYDTLNRLSNGLRYRFPANPGEHWEYTVIAFRPADQMLRIGNTRTIELIDATKTVETPIATFEDCLVYTSFDFQTASLIRHYIYIKPEVGLVGVDSYVGDDLYGQQRLIEFGLNKSL